MNALQRALQRREAIRQAAIEYHGWGRSRGDYKLSPDKHWEASTPEQRAACIELTTPIIERFERVMAGPYVFEAAADPDSGKAPA